MQAGEKVWAQESRTVQEHSRLRVFLACMTHNLSCRCIIDRPSFAISTKLLFELKYLDHGCTFKS